MSTRGAGARRRPSRRAASTPSRARRALVALGTVVLVITPISWILLHQPQADHADASVPYVTRDDDTYIITTNQPTVATPTAPDDPGSPTASPSTRTPKPSAPVTPGDTSSTTPTDGPTSGSTDGPGTGTEPSTPPSTGTTEDPDPSDRPTTTTSSSRTPTPSAPPPPADNGSMSADEAELFSLIDEARTANGCAPLRRNSNLTGSARNDAEGRAASGDVSGTEASKAAAGGDGMTAKKAFGRLRLQSPGTLFNCGLDELGVGRGDATYKDGGFPCGIIGVGCKEKTRVAWVVDFM